ncbi:MAG TPA: hypothetical protein VN715_19195 [Roseiarcus sp.]|nr:hypothetical protein [Roseiarcus sp.]
MKKFSAVFISGLFAAVLASSAVAPAYALGGCGPNRHRGAGGRCVAGGQHQGWCKHHTGHVAHGNGRGRDVCR